MGVCMLSSMEGKASSKVILFPSFCSCFVLNISQDCLKQPRMIVISIITLNVAPLKITHLAFADDLMLFAMGDIMSVKILMDCLSNFGFVSSLRLDILKSSLYTAGVHGQVLEDIFHLTNIPRGSMSSRYLGIHLTSGKLKVELIRAVSQGVECYWLSIFLIPTTITSRIVSLCRKFLWGSKEPLVAWKDLCLPRDEGGLGLKDLKSWNLALLSKSLWNIQHKKDTLWIRWVHQVYLQGTCIWDVFFALTDRALG
ncbi:uncharacterized protein LOC111409689 [Olea europaea var. sylvestris]|uniref:uncharacterized protein LOC111409689 n=1 Tax=Olea europaea var. sylvestris TaxID=158386 RepID=UPI000C1D6557|nr:uncharacterized protein LOC111409689 [Olea europaea var. sylvestris]